MSSAIAAKRRPAAPRHPIATYIATDRYTLPIPQSARTHSGFRAWVKSPAFPEKLRAAFIEGEIYLDMSNEELQTHVHVKDETARVLMNLNRELDRGQYFGDGALITNIEAKLSNNPDGAFISWASLETGLARLVPRKGRQGHFTEVEGRPDWVVEVVSDSSVEKDTKRLRAAYHRAEIPEYWLVDARGTDIAFHILHWRKAAYAAAPMRGDWQRSKVFDREFRFVREKTRFELWRYTLEYRSL
jgi:Uma2 family endonuclease